MITCKAILGLLILIILGFLVFSLAAGAGFLIGIVLKFVSWPLIILGTILGMVAVVIHLWDDKK